MASRAGPAGRELFYANGAALMVVPIETEPGFQAGTPETVFEGPDELLNVRGVVAQPEDRLDPRYVHLAIRQ